MRERKCIYKGKLTQRDRLTEYRILDITEIEWQCSDCRRPFLAYRVMFGISWCRKYSNWHREMVANTVSAAAADQDHKITQRGKRRCARTGALHLPPCILLLTLMKIDAIVSVVKQTCPLFSTIFYIIYLFHLRVHNIICNKKKKTIATAFVSHAYHMAMANPSLNDTWPGIYVWRMDHVEQSQKKVALRYILVLHSLLKT